MQICVRSVMYSTRRKQAMFRINRGRPPAIDMYSMDLHAVGIELNRIRTWELSRREDNMKKAASKARRADGGVLPTDVLYEVLLRLRAKEVCRVRLVCRRCRSLTSDPVFARDHGSRHQHLVGLRHGDMDEVHVLHLSGNIVKRIRRLVCRRWRSLTSDPVFARDHGSRHQHLVGLRHGDLDEVHVLHLSGNIVKRIRLEHRFSTNCFFNAEVDLICVGVDWGKACVLINLATGCGHKLTTRAGADEQQQGRVCAAAPICTWACSYGRGRGLQGALSNLQNRIPRPNNLRPSLQRLNTR
jgi:hypothetical protein